MTPEFHHIASARGYFPAKQTADGEWFPNQMCETTLFAANNRFENKGYTVIIWVVLQNSSLLYSTIFLPFATRHGLDCQRVSVIGSFYCPIFLWLPVPWHRKAAESFCVVSWPQSKSIPKQFSDIISRESFSQDLPRGNTKTSCNDQLGVIMSYLSLQFSWPFLFCCYYMHAIQLLFPSFTDPVDPTLRTVLVLDRRQDTRPSVRPRHAWLRAALLSLYVYIYMWLPNLGM